MCSRIGICVQGLVYVFEDVHSLCSRIGICVQSVNGVLKVVNVCSRMCICVRGCDRCPKS
jgi:hypothetical protein